MSIDLVVDNLTACKGVRRSILLLTPILHESGRNVRPLSSAAT